MKLSIEHIKKYMQENNIDNNLETCDSIPSLGIYKIKKESNKFWKIYIQAPIDSIYKNGFFKLYIEFPDNFPQTHPTIKFISQIYHLQVNPSDGRTCINFINYWKSDITISEIFVGIYLFFKFDQNKDSPFSGHMGKLYSTNRVEFNRIAEEWTKKYCSPTNEDIQLINQMHVHYSLDNRFINLNNQMKKMQEELKLINRELISVIFINEQKDILCSVICSEHDSFSGVEKSFYEKSIKYKGSERYFTLNKNGNKIDKNKSLKENEIYDCEIIIVH